MRRILEIMLVMILFMASGLSAWQDKKYDEVVDSTSSLSVQTHVNRTSIENDSTKLVYATGFNFNLNSFHAKCVLEIPNVLSERYTGWSDKIWNNGAGGTHTDETTHYKTDNQSIGFTSASPGASSDGISLDFTDMNFTLFSSGDTCVEANYFKIWIKTTTQDIADLPDVNGLAIAFCCDTRPTMTNLFITYIDDSALGDGENFIEIALSAFSETNSPDWSDVKGITIYLNGAADGQINETFFDCLQIVRKSADGNYANPYQQETSVDVWEDVWEQGGAHNFWCVKEITGRVAAMAGDNVNTSYIQSAETYGDINVSGKIKMLASGNTYFLGFSSTANQSMVLFVGNTTITSYDSATSVLSPTHSVTAADWNGKEIWFEVTKRGRVVSYLFSNDGHEYVPATPLHTYTAPQKITISLYPDQRLYSLGASSVESAVHATVADGLSVPLGNLGRWHKGIGVLEWFINADSSYFTPGDTIKAR